MHSSLSEVWRALGRRDALSSWIWIVLSPITALLAAFAIPASTPADRAWLFAAGVAAILIKGSILALAQRLIGPSLNGRRRDVLAVIVLWGVATAIGMTFLAATASRWIGAPDPELSTALGWWLTWTAEQVVVAASWSAHRQVAVRVSRTLTVAQHEIASARANASAAAAYSEAVRREVERLVVPAVVGCRDHCPASNAEPAEWREFSDELISVALGPVRTASRTVTAAEFAEAIAKSTEGDATSANGDSSQASVSATQVSLWGNALKMFPTVQPVSLIAPFALLPILINLVVVGRVSLGGAVLATLWTLGMTVALAVLFRRQLFRRLWWGCQWLLITVGTAVVVVVATLITTDLDNQSDLVIVTARLQLPAQIALLTLAILAMNVCLGTIATVGKIESTRAASTLAAVTAQVKGISGKDRLPALRREVSSRLHGETQSRLVALSMIAQGVADGIRDSEDWSPRIRGDLARMMRQLSWVGDVADGPKVEQVDGRRMALIREAWEGALSLEVAFDSTMQAAVVPTDQAMRLALVVTEGIANAAKHGRARKVRVDITAGGTDSIDVLVSADGNRPIRPVVDGTGLTAISAATGHRWKLTEGTRGRGSVLTASIPVVANARNSTITSSLI